MTARRARKVDRRTLGRIGFTDHAIERFAERAGLDLGGRGRIEPIVRELLLREGRVVPTAPGWYRSRNSADGYVQIGEWMLLICRVDRRRDGTYDVVTIVTNGDGMTWAKARRRGLVKTAPPVRAVRGGWLRRALARLLGR